MIKSNYTQNREISWLRFNERVLEEVLSDEVRLFEKLKFISIFTNNLTEFFMIRIGSLTDLAKLKKKYKDNKTGMTAKHQIDAVMKILPDMYKKKDKFFKLVSKELEEFTITKRSFSSLSTNEFLYLKQFFYDKILPFLSPQIINDDHRFPFLENDQLYIFIEIQKKKKKNYALIPVLSEFPKYIFLPNNNKFDFMLIEEILLHFSDLLFSSLHILKKAIINITRNFDSIDTNEFRDEFEDYKNYMKGVLKRRKKQQVVRVESNISISKSMKSFLVKKLNLSKDSFFITKSPLKMDYVFSLVNALQPAIKKQITNKPFKPVYKFPIKNKESMISVIEKKDTMLHYPYDDIEVMLDLIKEASIDVRVVSIKITIYRLAKNSKLVKYLCDASQNGKAVTVFMELRARFDEENNINYSDILQEFGCNIIYGFKKFKTHSKICLISYKSQSGIKFITQIGTGNYNEVTSKFYSDLSLITGNQEIGIDAKNFFNNLECKNILGQYKHLLQAPYSLKAHILKLMDIEKGLCKDGFLRFKVNSLTDKDIIKKLKDCSLAGVQIKMIIRGISCLLPAVRGSTENIEIRSIVGRFLEHSRIYIFGKGKRKKYYISSADMMTRNMERRIEIAVPIYDKTIQLELDEYFAVQLKDNLKGKKMNNIGEYEFIDQTEKFSSQNYFMEKADKII